MRRPNAFDMLGGCLIVAFIVATVLGCMLLVRAPIVVAWMVGAALFVVGCVAVGDELETWWAKRKGSDRG